MSSQKKKTLTEDLVNEEIVQYKVEQINIERIICLVGSCCFFFYRRDLMNKMYICANFIWLCGFFIQ